MSIRSEINRIMANIESAYAVIASMGGEPQLVDNSENLAKAIATIPSGEGGGGDVEFYDVTVTNTATAANPQQIQANTCTVCYESEEGYKTVPIRPNNVSETIRTRGLVIIKPGLLAQGPPATGDSLRVIGSNITVIAVYVDKDGSYTYAPA